MNITAIKDKITGLYRTLTDEEKEAVEEWRGNRAAYRQARRSMRRKGPGYTRAMRDGREQRVVEMLRLVVNQPAKTERDRYGRGPRRHPHRTPRRRHDH